MSARGATKSTTAPHSASGRYRLVCELEIPLSGGGCVALGRLCPSPEGGECGERSGRHLLCCTSSRSTSLVRVSSPAIPQLLCPLDP